MSFVSQSLVFILFTFSQLAFADHIDDLWESLDNAQGKGRLVILQKIEHEVFDNINIIIKESTLKELNASNVNPENFFNSRLKKYQKYLSEIDFKKDLKGLRDGGSDYVDKNLTNELKELRGRANKVRTSFYVFDETHEAPEAFAKFVASFGKLNDAIASNNHKKIKLRAEKTLALFKETEDLSIKKSFEALNEDQFRNYLEELNKKMTTLLKKSSISVDEFHEIRKDLKQIHSSYDAILSLKGIKNEDSATSMLLDDLIDQMGKLTDVYTDIEITHLLELEDHTIKIPVQMEKNLRKTLDFFSNDLCDLKFQ